MIVRKGLVLLLLLVLHEAIAWSQTVELAHRYARHANAVAEHAHAAQIVASSVEDGTFQRRKEEEERKIIHAMSRKKGADKSGQQRWRNSDRSSAENDEPKLFAHELPPFARPRNDHVMRSLHIQRTLIESIERLEAQMGDDFAFQIGIPAGRDENGNPVFVQQRVDPPFLKSLLDRIIGLFPSWNDEGDDDDNNAKNVEYRVVPLDTEELLWGLLTGILNVFMPTMAESNSGAETMAKFQMCFDPRKLREQFYVKDLFTLQDGEQGISTDDIDEFVSLLESEDKFSLQNIFDTLGRMSQSAKKVYGHVTFLLHRLAPYLLNLMKHAYLCGLLDPVIGILVTFVVGLMPFLLFILVPVALALFAYEIYAQVRSLIENWNKDWFRFGKSAGALIGYLAVIFITYKINQYKQKKAAIRCDNSGSVKCGVQLPDDEMKYWSDKKQFQGNQVLQRDGLIDPYRVDSKGRTNLQRMSKGLSPVGPDGLPVNLHHMDQTPGGAIAELSQTFHKENHGALHKFLSDTPSKIDRNAFASWRRRYWIDRGADLATKLATGGGGGGIPWDVIAPIGGAIVTRGIDWGQATAQLGNFVREIVDDYTDGMAWNDLIGWILSTMKGSITNAALETDAEAAARVTDLQRCSWDPECQSLMPIGHLDHQDGVLAKSGVKKYQVEFAGTEFRRRAKKDDGTEFAMSIGVRANQGAFSVQVTGPSGKVASKAVIGDRKKKENPEFVTAIMGCHGTGAHSVQIEALRASRRESDSDVDGYRKGKGDWDGVELGDRLVDNDETSKQAFFDIVAQWVPLPLVPEFSSNAVKKVKATSDSVTLSVHQKATSNMEIEGQEENLEESLMTYHVYAVKKGKIKSASTSTPSALVCGVLAHGHRAATYVDTNPTDTTQKIKLRAKGLDADTEYQLYVVAENSGGAMAAYEPVEAETEPATPAGLIVGLTLGILALCVVTIACVAVAILVVAKKRRNPNRKSGRWAWLSPVSWKGSAGNEFSEMATRNDYYAKLNDEEDDLAQSTEEAAPFPASQGRQDGPAYVPPAAPPRPARPPPPTPQQQQQQQPQASQRGGFAGLPTGYSLLNLVTRPQ